VVLLRVARATQNNEPSEFFRIEPDGLLRRVHQEIAQDDPAIERDVVIMPLGEPGATLVASRALPPSACYSIDTTLATPLVAEISSAAA